MSVSDLDYFDESSTIQDVIKRLNDLVRTGDYVFRGYGKQEELLPNIIRGRVNFTDIEGDLLKDFEKYGSSYFHATNPIDFMSHAQHFGLPTRLLDFTHNPFIALSFSLYTTKSNADYANAEDKYFYYVRYASLTKNLCLTSIPLSDDIYNSELTRTDSLATRACQCIDSIEDFFGENKLDRSILSIIQAIPDIRGVIKDMQEAQEKIREHVILFVDPNQSNQRIIMQQGLFMFPYTLEKEEHLRILDEHSQYIMVHKNHRDELIQYLDALGYNTFRLMPDLSSICEAVKRRNIDKRARKRRKK